MKQRLTITLSESVLKRVDSLIDRVHIRNRSHAIEHLITKSLAPKLDTAILLCGGEEYQQKAPLTEVGGEPILFQMIKELQSQGITRVLLSLGSKGGAIKELIAKSESLKVRIEYKTETKQLGTAGAVKQWQQQLDEGAPVLVMHGDVLTALDLEDMLSFHQKEDALATIAVKPRLSKREYGQVFLKGNHVVTFSTSGQPSGISIINSGYYLIDPAVLDRIPGDTVSKLEADVFPSLAKENALRAYFFQGMWFDITDPLQLAEARKRWM